MPDGICVAKRRLRLVKKCMEYEVEESQTKRKAKEYLERGCGKGLSSM